MPWSQTQFTVPVDKYIREVAEFGKDVQSRALVRYGQRDSEWIRAERYPAGAQGRNGDSERYTDWRTAPCGTLWAVLQDSVPAAPTAHLCPQMSKARGFIHSPPATC